MSFDEALTLSITSAVQDAIAPLAARIAELEKLLTTTGGERPGDLLKKSQVAKRLGVTTRTVDRWTAEGKLRAPMIINGRRRWRVQDIRDFEGDVTR